MKYTKKDDFKNFFEFLKFNNIKMKSCSEVEILELKEIATNNLPDCYLIFMENAGNGIDFLRGSSYCMSEIHQIKNWAAELLEEDGSTENLTDDDFVFFMHQGYQFHFFKLNEGDDPPIYFYEEGGNYKKFIKRYDSITDFFITLYNEVVL